MKWVLKVIGVFILVVLGILVLSSILSTWQAFISMVLSGFLVLWLWKRYESKSAKIPKTDAPKLPNETNDIKTPV